MLSNALISTITRFINELEVFSDAYPYITLNYVAVKSGTHLKIISARITCNIVSNPHSPGIFAAGNIVAGHIDLEKDVTLLRKSIKLVLAEGIATPVGQLKLSYHLDGSSPFTYHSFHPDAARNQTKISFLQICGVPVQELVKQPDTDWQLMAADIPYNGLEELLTEYGLSLPDSSESVLEVIAYAVAGFNGDKCNISNGIASIDVILAAGLNPQDLRLSYRVIHDSGVTRKAVDGSCISWTPGPVQYGTFSFPVQERALVHCCVSYEGTPLSHWWLVDQSSWPNYLQGIYNAFDTDSSDLREALFQGSARNLETAVCRLLWMLGLSPVHLGSLEGKSNTPDLIAQTPAGNILVIECTTGFFNNNSKPQKLLERVKIVREVLGNTYAHLGLLPVIVTNKRANEVAHEMQDIRKAGIVPVTAEDLLIALDQARLRPNPEKVYNDLWTDLLMGNQPN